MDELRHAIRYVTSFDVGFFYKTGCMQQDLQCTTGDTPYNHATTKTQADSAADVSNCSQGLDPVIKLLSAAALVLSMWPTSRDLYHST